MSENLKSRLLSLFILIAVAMGAVVYLRTRSTLDGWWLKKSGPGRDQMTVKVSSGSFRMRYWDGAGVTTVTMLLDGKGHTLTASSDPLSGVVTSTSYWAEMKGNTLLITTKFETIPPRNLPAAFHQEAASTETWSVGTDGRLVISNPGEADGIYERASLWKRLWRAAP